MLMHAITWREAKQPILFTQMVFHATDEFSDVTPWKRCMALALSSIFPQSLL
jgi:hypothetical protein